MGRVSFLDDFYLHRKASSLTLAELGLFVCSVAFARHNETDGYIPADRLHSLGRLPNGLEVCSHEILADSLLTAALWEQADHGYVVHHYADYQLTRAELEARRERERLRKARVRGGPQRTATDTVFKAFDSSVSDLAATAQYSAPLPISQKAEPRDTTPFASLRDELTGCDERTLPAWLSAAKGLPAEWACARALESLQRARERGRVRNEAGYVTRVFQRLRAERAT